MSDWQSKTRTGFQQQNETSVITEKINTFGGDAFETFKFGIGTFGLGVFGLGLPETALRPITLNWQMPIDTDDMMSKDATSWQEKNA